MFFYFSQMQYLNLYQPTLSRFLQYQAQEKSGFEVYQEADVLVTKIGGDNASRIRENVERIHARKKDDKEQIVVVSAIRSSSPEFNTLRHPDVGDLVKKEANANGFNTTSHLIGIGRILGNLNELREAEDECVALEKERAYEFLLQISEFTYAILDREFETVPDPIRTEVNMCLNHLESAIVEFDPRAGDRVIALDSDWIIQKANRSVFSITGLGEQLARQIYQAAFSTQGLRSKSIDLDEEQYEVGFEIDPRGLSEAEESEKGAALLEAEAQVMATVKSLVLEVLEDEEEENNVLVLGGHAAGLASQRGYSDKMGAYIASFAAEARNKVVYLVEKEFPIMSADPRKVKAAKVLEHINAMFSAEAFGSVYGANAGAIQEEALDILAEAEVDTLVLNPKHIEEGKITRIHSFESDANRVEMVATKAAPYVLEITSRKMNAEGIASYFLQWFEEKGVSIDHIFTTQKTIALTFNNGKVNETLISALETDLKEDPSDQHFSLNLRADQRMIFCMGNNMRRPGISAAASIACALGNINIKSITQGPSQQMMVYAVDDAEADLALQLIHRISVEIDDNAFDGLLAPHRSLVADLIS